MTRLLMLRHAATAWTAAGRLQGHADPPLSAAGRAEAASWRLPDTFARAPILASPLRRARETAAHLGNAAVEPRLVEMDWGAWEGARLADLRSTDPTGMAAHEALGLDLQPPGGERPRDVMGRLAALFEDLADGTDRVLVCHKGVMRAALVLATGWDMTTKPPLRLTPAMGWLFTLDSAGRPQPAVDVVALGGEIASCGR